MATNNFKKEDYPKNSFKITVMGSVGSGKTSLCTQMTSNYFSDVHMHTRKVKSHVRMMKVVRDYESSSSIEYPLIPQTVPLYYVHSKTKDDVSTAEVESYGLELQDTPGRVIVGTKGDDYKLNKGAEMQVAREIFFSAPQPTPTEYSQWYRDPNEDPEAEREPLVSKIDMSNFRMPDQLLNWKPSMGYVVMFDLTQRSSLLKAQSVVDYLRANTNPDSFQTQIQIQQYIPIYLFGNKSDLCGDLANHDVLRAAISYVEDMWDLVSKDKVSKVAKDSQARYNKLRDNGWTELSQKIDKEDVFADKNKPKNMSYQNAHSYVRLCYGNIKHGQVTFYKDDQVFQGQWLPKDGPFQMEELFHRMVARMVQQPDYIQKLYRYCLAKDQKFVQQTEIEEGYYDDPVGVEERVSFCQRCCSALGCLWGSKGASKKS